MRIFGMMMYQCLWQIYALLCLFLLQYTPYFYLAHTWIIRIKATYYTKPVVWMVCQTSMFYNCVSFLKLFINPHFSYDKGWDWDITPLIVMARIVEVRVKLLHYSATRLKWFTYWIPWSVLPVLSKFIKLSWSDISK